MLTTADIAGLVRIRACADLTLENWRTLRAGDFAYVSPAEAQRHVQCAEATIEPEPERKPASCSARRDELWKAGIR